MPHMRDYLLIYINGQAHEISGEEAWLTLSQYLRQRLRLTGTKIVCEEGDCGSCSVLLADLLADHPVYTPVDSCICFLFQLDGHHVVTVEGLSHSPELSTVQQSMIDCHGSQCGFCTPGFVMAMTGVMERATCGSTRVAAPDWRTELSGNLCRCTGYQPILNACEQLKTADYVRLDERYPIAAMQASYAPLEADIVAIAYGKKKCFLPVTIAECLELKSLHPEARLVAGATDIGVQSNKRHSTPDVVIGLRRIAELQSIEVHPDHLQLGAGVTWSQMLPILEASLPSFAEVIKVFGSPQIRNMGTIGGNLANASPIADSLPLLHVMECELKLASVSGTRWLNINKFYKGYKQYDLNSDEIIASAKLPRLTTEDRLRLYKVSRRRDMDISTFTAAIRMRVQAGIIEQASIAFGAVGPIVLRLPKTEAYLKDKAFTKETMQAAGDVAVQEITPISDVRGSADYRYQLSKNVLMKFYYEESR